MIDKNKIFDLFGSPIQSEKDFIEIASNMLDEPFNKIGMFTKLIINHIIFHQKLSKFLNQESNIAMNFEETKRASAFAIFNRAWFYIKQIDLKSKNDFEAIIKFKKEPFLSVLDEAIEYFEDEEEYEKCAKLLEIKKFKENY
jgi:hypothetical protein|tara:strand:- start:345 stop:770 length:426 start_codon:yes stop_codon:yes gene_type:complete